MFLQQRVAYKIEHDSVKDAVHEYNAMTRAIGHASEMQGYWSYEDFKELDSVRAGSRDLSTHYRVNYSQK